MDTILPNDIILRKTAEGATLWLSQRMVIECCSLSDDYQKIARHRYRQSLPASWQKVVNTSDYYLGDTGKSWRWGRRAGQYYYDYDRIPNRAPASFRELLPTKDEMLTHLEAQEIDGLRARKSEYRQILKQAMLQIEDNADGRWLETQSGYQIEGQILRDYVRALAWCRIISRVTKLRDFKRFGATTVGAFYDLCADTISSQKLANLKITTPATLRNKMASFPTDIEAQRMWIVSGKFGNNNRQIVGATQLVDEQTGELYKFDIHQAIMYAAYINVDKPQKERLKALYETMYIPMITDFGVTAIALRTFCNHMTRFSNRLLSARARHGDEYYKKMLLTYCPCERLTYAHSLFAADGSGLIAYRYCKRTKEGEEMRCMNIYTMLVSDVASGYIAGWSVAPEGSHKETPEMVKAAVKMAVKNGGNQTMFELVSDNHGAFTGAQSKEFLKSVFNRVRTIEAKNSQANPAETQFRLFKNSTLRAEFNFIRSSHGSTNIENQANVENIEIMDYPTYGEVVVQMRGLIDKWNNTPRADGQTPAEKFAHKHPDCQSINEVTLRKINGVHTQLEVTRMRGIVEVKHNNVKHLYEIPHYATTGARLISQATGNGYQSNVVVVYDHTGADIYSTDGKFILSCPPADLSKQAYIESTPESRAARVHSAERKREQWDATEDWQRDVTTAFRAVVNTTAVTVNQNDDDGESMGYEIDVHFGGTKESYNAYQESHLPLNTANLRTATKTRRKLEKQEIRATERQQEKEKSNIQERYLARLRRNFENTTHQQ